MKLSLKLSLSLAALGVAAAGAPLYIGCYMDCSSGQHECNEGYRDLPTFFCSNGRTPEGGHCAVDPDLPAGASWYAGGNKMTPSLCNDMCQGFHFFGVQYYNECFCGNDYGNQGGKAPESECNTPCKGDPSIMCGGGAHSSIYAVNTTTA